VFCVCFVVFSGWLCGVVWVVVCLVFGGCGLWGGVWGVWGGVGFVLVGRGGGGEGGCWGGVGVVGGGVFGGGGGGGVGWE